jgi:hypothetical protein
MANEQKAETSDLDVMAFKLYSQKLAGRNGSRVGERDAVESYAQAEAFLAVQRKARNGGLKPKAVEAQTLAPFSAPKLDRLHPHNLVSQRFGNLDTVNRIAKWLNDNPTPEKEPDELVGRFNETFSLKWDLPTVNVARAVFPHYAKVS